jgi:hypothetical protein
MEPSFDTKWDLIIVWHKNNSYLDISTIENEHPNPKNID